MALKEKTPDKTLKPLNGEAKQGRLEGKICLITGGAGNIGEQITAQFLSEGATCIITGRNDKKLGALCNKLIGSDKNGKSQRLHALAFDGSKPEEIDSAMTTIQQEFGRIDVLINNAGSAGPKQPIADLPFTRADLDDLKSKGFTDSETVADALHNVLGISWMMTRAAYDLMPIGGSVINVSTIFSRTEYFGRAAYSVPKSALNALSRHMAKELGLSKKAIRLNLVYPGPIESERIHTVFGAMDKLKGDPPDTTANHFFDTMVLQRIGEDGLKKRFPSIQDVVNTILFLASDESLGFGAHGFEVTNGMQIGMESRTTLTSKPKLRIADGTGKRALIVAGDQDEDAVTFAKRLQEAHTDVILVFQDQSHYERMSAEYKDLDIRHFDAINRHSITAFFDGLLQEGKTVDYAILFPRSINNFQRTRVLGSSNGFATEYLCQEVGGALALASSLSRFYMQSQAKLDETPKVLFVSAAAYEDSPYHDIQRAANEELIRIWRDEFEVLRKKGLLKFGISANQLLRHNNRDENNLELAAAYAIELLATSKKIDEINLYMPEHVALPATNLMLESLYGMNLGQVAVITGGSEGIGGQLGRMLAATGARVVLAARREAELEKKREEIIRELEGIGYASPEKRVSILPNTDVSDEAGLQHLIDFTIKTYGRIDYLINNAGISGAELMVVDMPVQAWRHTLKANLISNFSLMHKVLPVMKEQGSGYILNVSSYFGGEKYVAVPYPNRADYAVSKAGQRALAENFAKFLGPEIIINALAPGPVAGIRLRGTDNRPGLFERRGKLILSTKRLNDLYGSTIKALREGAKIEDILKVLEENSVEALINGVSVHQRLQNFGYYIQKTADSDSSSYTHIMDKVIAERFIMRLKVGNHLTDRRVASDFLKNMPNAPEPFFTDTSLKREAKKIEDGILSMLYLKRMPTEEDVALASVHYLASQNVSGETFHPSGGLRFDRTVPEGELFGKPKTERLVALEGKIIYIFGDYLFEEIRRLVETYVDEYKVKHVVLMTKSTYTAEHFRMNCAKWVESGHLHVRAVGLQLEEAVDRAVSEFGRPDAVISTPFDPIPIKSLVADRFTDWENVFNEKDFEDLIEQHLTYHFRIARKCSLLGELQVVLVTPKTSSRSTAEEFALANFIKTTLHSLTATLGVENERCIHHCAVNQVDMTRRAKSEKPQAPDEIREELERFVTACLLTSAPLPSPDESRYRSRIYRGNAITV